MKIYLVIGFGKGWQRVFAVKTDREKSITLAKLEAHKTLHGCQVWTCGCQVWEYEVDKDDGEIVKIYPNW